MDITSSTAAFGYLQNKSIDAAPATGESNGLQQAAANFEATLKNSEELSKSAILGEADPNALVQALAQTELAVEAVVAIRNKVVEAYQEILRMPV